MTMPDVSSLMPSDDELAARRDALVQEFRRTPQQRGRNASAGLGPHGPARPASRDRRRFALVAVVGAIAVAAATLPGSPTGEIDVVAEARAAAAPVPGGVLHTVVQFKQTPDLGPTRISTGPPPDGKVVGTLTGKSERWSSDDPVRWRSRVYIETPEGKTATAESSYADGVTRLKNSWDPTVRAYRLPADLRARQDQGSDAGPRLGSVEGPGDPVADIRRLLDSGRVRDEGEATFEGRAVRRLVGQTHVQDRSESSEGRMTYEYLVDVASFAPVRISSSQVLPGRPNAEEPAARRTRTTVSSWTFVAYQRLPATPANERLLSVQSPD